MKTDLTKKKMDFMWIILQLVLKWLTGGKGWAIVSRNMPKDFDGDIVPLKFSDGEPLFVQRI